MSTLRRLLSMRPGFGGLARGTVLTAAGLAARAGLQAAYLVLLSRWLGAEGYGLFAGSVAAVILLFPLAGWGMGYVFTERHADGAATRALWSRALSQAWLSGAIVAVLAVAVAAAALDVRVDVVDLALIAVAELVAMPVTQVAANSLVALRRSDLSALATCAVPAGRLVGALALAGVLAAPSLHALAITHCVGSLVATALVIALSRHVVHPTVGAQAGPVPGRLELFREGAPYAATMLASLSYSEVDKVLVLQLLGATAAGTYTAAFRVMSVFVIPITALITNSLPRLFAAERAGHAPHLLRRVAFAAVGYGLLGGAAAAAVSPFMPLVFGAGFAQSAHYVLLLAAWIPLVALHLTGASALVAAGGKLARLAIEATGLVAVTALNWWLLPRLGVPGAVVALVACELYMAAGCWLALGRRRRRGAPA